MSRYKVGDHATTAYPKIDTSILYKIASDYFSMNCESALDIGCGSGNSTYQLLHHFSNVTGIDKDPLLIDEAKKKWAIPGLHFMAAEAESLEAFFKHMKFDLVLMILTMHHCDMKKVIPSVRKLLRKRGDLILIDVYARPTKSVSKYILNRTLENFREFLCLARSACRLGMVPVLKFQISVMRFMLSRSGRDHIANDLLQSRSHSLQEWNSQIEKLLPGCNISVLLPGIMLCRWNNTT